MRESSDGAIPALDVDAIARVLAEAPVTLAVLYGSHARSEATASSDVDVAVEFVESCSSVEQTRARLDLIERLSAELDADVDVVPLSRASPALRREICEDGIVMYGSPSALEAFRPRESPARTHEERLAEFDDLLADIERVV